MSKAKAERAEQTSGRKTSTIDRRKQELIGELESLRPPEVILPTFSLRAAEQTRRTLLSVHNGSVGYRTKPPLLQNVSLSLEAGERVALSGSSGSGKSTLLRAILGDQSIAVAGDWHLPRPSDIGYLDQHYANLNRRETVYESLAKTKPQWQEAEIRKHLAAFLFRKNGEVNTLVEHLSGGEKDRLSLSLIAATTPKLLLLDEITNNLDLETKEHVVQVLGSYPGAMLVVSHDTDFLQRIAISQTYELTPSQANENPARFIALL